MSSSRSPALACVLDLGALVSQLLFAALLAVYRMAPAWIFVLATAGFLAYTA